jgi:hypothetical protein
MIFSTYWADEEEEPDLTFRWIEGSIDIVRVLRMLIIFSHCLMFIQKYKYMLR